MMAALGVVYRSSSLLDLIMTNITEKEIFRIEHAKIVLDKLLELELKIDFAELDTYLSNNFVAVDIYLFKKLYGSSQVIVQKVEAVLAHFCPSLKCNVRFLVVRNPKMYPKYYYSLFYHKYRKYKLNPFSALNKLENLVLPSEVSGVYLRVKGKRGARKDRGSVMIGDVSKHSLKLGKLKTHKNIVETPMGVMGIYITLMYRYVK